MRYNSVMAMAMHDIGIETPKNKPFEDVWFVRPSHLETKENRKLNRRLCLHKINK